MHARLSIVDQGEIAHQPLVDSTNKVMIAFNGEVYNYRELRATLGDYCFQSHSDTEVILAGYLKYGVEWMQKLRGMFSVAIADERNQRLLLIRDPIGKKPLFVATWDDGIYFGSSVVALSAATRTHVAVNADYLDAWWELGHAPAGTALIENAFSVRPGEVIEYDWEGNVVATRSCVPQIVRTSVPSSVEEASEELGRLLEQAVSRRLENNPKPNLLLSGGIDSTVIASVLARKAEAGYLTLGSFFPGTHDERFAKFAARRLGVELSILRPNPLRFHCDILACFELQDEALAIFSFFPLALLCRLASSHGRVLFTGDGGDEVFLGYGQPSDWICNDKAIYEPSIACGPPVQDWMSPWGRRTAISGLLAHMFSKLDRASAEQAVETRCPLLDWDVMTFARSLPSQLLFHNGTPKGLLKTQLKGWPDKFINRKKNGFAYSLRWAWAMTGFSGLRELIVAESQETFANIIPASFRRPSKEWTSKMIFQNFSVAWKLAVWSAFLRRLERANTK